MAAAGFFRKGKNTLRFPHSMESSPGGGSKASDQARTILSRLSQHPQPASSEAETNDLCTDFILLCPQRSADSAPSVLPASSSPLSHLKQDASSLISSSSTSVSVSSSAASSPPQRQSQSLLPLAPVCPAPSNTPPIARRSIDEFVFLHTTPASSPASSSSASVSTSLHPSSPALTPAPVVASAVATHRSIDEFEFIGHTQKSQPMPLLSVSPSPSTPVHDVPQKVADGFELLSSSAQEEKTTRTGSEAELELIGQTAAEAKTKTETEEAEGFLVMTSEQRARLHKSRDAPEADFEMLSRAADPLVFCDLNRNSMVNVEPEEEDTNEWSLVPKESPPPASPPLSDSALLDKDADVQCHSSLILTHLTSMKVKGLGSNFRCSKSDCQAGILMAGVFGRTREKALCYLCTKMFCAKHIIQGREGPTCEYCLYFTTQTVGPMISRSAEHEAKRKRCAEERRKCIEERTQKILPHIERLYNTTLSTLRPLVQFSASLENLNIFKKVIWSARGTWEQCQSCKLEWKHECDVCGACICAKCRQQLTFLATAIQPSWEEIEITAFCCTLCLETISYYCRELRFRRTFLAALQKT